MQNVRTQKSENLYKNFCMESEHGVTVTISAGHSGGLQFKACLRRNFFGDFSSFGLFNHVHSSEFIHISDLTETRPAHQ